MKITELRPLKVYASALSAVLTRYSLYCDRNEMISDISTVILIFISGKLTLYDK